jgi:hypothetical protein
MELRCCVWSCLLAVLFLSSCTSVPERRPIDSGRPDDVPSVLDSAPVDAPSVDAPMSDAVAIDAFDPRPADFRLVLLDRPLTITRGEIATLHVRIDRVGGFSAPVLIDLWGLPDTLWAQARESRVGDDVIDISVEASEDAAPVADTPFAVQASALGIRRVERTTISVR